MDPVTISRYLQEVSHTLDYLPVRELMLAGDLLASTRKEGHVWIIGNGGSAATAMHFANDLQKMCNIQAVAIPAQISSITAYGNDCGWANMYTEYMKKTFYNGDVLVAISCSGASANIVNAAKEATRGGHIIALTGPANSKNALAKLPGIIIEVKHDDIKVIEDVHLAVCHCLAGVLKDE